MKPDKAIDRLEEDFDPYRECPTLLDVGMVEPFLQWLNDNIEYLEHLEQKRWRIGVLSRHLAARPDLEASLKNVGIETLEDHFTDSDEALVMEMLHAYFGGNGVYRKAAQLLAYGRKHFEESDDVQVISRLRVFRLIPKVQLYFIPGVDYRGNDEELYYLRLLDVLKIHSKVQDAAYTRIMNGDYPVAVSEATKTLIDEVRKIGNAHGLSFAQNTSDQPMIDQAIRNEEHDKSSGKKKEVNPAIQLNDPKKFLGQE